MPLVNYHIHTQRCGHALGDILEYVEAAENVAQLHEIGISEHITISPYQLLPQTALPEEEIATYISEMLTLKNNYQGPLRIKLGAEVDFFLQNMVATHQLIDRFPFDYVIGSIHFIEDFGFDDERQIGLWREFGTDWVVEQYLFRVKQLISSNLFDIIGHLDLVKKFGFVGSNIHRYQELLILLQRSKMCLEVNSSGWDKPCNEQYPSKELLEHCFALNIPITLGTDAHQPQEVNRHLTKLRELVWAVGYRKLATFSRRNKIFIPL